MKTFTLAVLILSATTAYCQHEADNWFFGDHAGITFSTNPPSVLPGGSINTAEGCASVSDASGNLLFYTDGVTVWDRNHNQMPNGSGLGGGMSSTQSCVAVKQPGSISLYYLFTVPQVSTVAPITYSELDMTLNSGNGAITNKNIYLADSSTEKLTAVNHANDTDIWVISHATNSADYYAWLVTAAGVSSTPVVSTIGLIYTGTNIYGQGYLKTSPCGNKIAAASTKATTFELFDFDNSTGIISDSLLLHGPDTTGGGPYGVEFSPDNSKVYTSIYTPYLIIQYDLLAGSNAAIIASADTIAFSTNKSGGALQTGPDGKIYFSKYLDTMLGCIANPNLQGAACSYIDSCVSIGSSGGWPGLPNFLTSYFCGLNVNISFPEISNSKMTLYPNPAKDAIHISFNSYETGSAQLSFFNMLGVKVYDATINVNVFDKDFTISLTHFQNGVYMVKVQTKNGVESRKLLVN